MKKQTNERTSPAVASTAGRLLGGASLRAAEKWLENMAMADPSCDDEDRTHALTLLGAIAGMRSLAGSALTQK